MMMAKVIDKVVSTRKHDGLQGIKLLAVQGLANGEILVAGDLLGAGIGEVVLVSLGEPAILAVDKKSPVDAMIVGIVDKTPCLGREN